MLRDSEIAEIRRSFALVVPRAQVVFGIFYDRLFEIAPQTRSMFPEDMTAQRGKLIATLANVVQSLENFHLVLADLESMGARHCGYGVAIGDYELVGEALIWTLENSLDPEDWSAETKAAWLRAYGMLVTVMTREDPSCAA